MDTADNSSAQWIFHDLTATIATTAHLVRSGANPELGVEQGQQLAAGVQEQVSFLITNCKLEPKADAVLHGLIGGLLEGSEKSKQQMVIRRPVVGDANRPRQYLS
ncbi:MAG: hypothetical protein ABTR07_13560 [Candidatus Competibacter denitrificans]